MLLYELYIARMETCL